MVVCVEVRSVYGYVESYEGDTSGCTVDLFTGGFVAVDEDDGDVSIVYGALLANDDDVSIYELWLHGSASDTEGEEFTTGSHTGRDFFPSFDVFDGFQRDTRNDAAENGDADSLDWRNGDRGKYKSSIFISLNKVSRSNR